jgi:hypothetical protein
MNAQANKKSKMKKTTEYMKGLNFHRDAKYNVAPLKEDATADEVIQNAIDTLLGQGVKNINIATCDTDGTIIVSGKNPSGNECAVLIAPNTMEIHNQELCDNIGIKLNAPKKESENTKNKETTNTMNSILADIENGKKVQVFDYSSLTKEEADELFEEIGGKDNVVFVETTNEEFEAIKNVENIETYKIEKNGDITTDKKEDIKTCKIEKKIETNSTDKKEDINIEMNANSNTNTNTPRVAPSVPNVPAEEWKDFAEITQTAIPSSRAERASGGFKISTDLPLYMREGGKEEIQRRRKELETYLKLLNRDPATMINKHTFVCLNPATLDPEMVGEQQAKDIREWFGDKTQEELNRWLGCGTHKVDGKSWCCGELGSRWADKKINGRQVRFAFYADKDQKPEHLKHLAYSIVLDASM